MRLRELVKSTGVVAAERDLDKAGAEIGIWPDSIERRPLQQWDNRANKVLGSEVYKKRPIRLTAAERKIVEEWIFAFLVRSPENRRLCMVAANNATLTRHTNESLLSDYYSNPDEVIRKCSIQSPRTWQHMVDRFGLDNVRHGLLWNCRTKISSGYIDRMTSGVDTFHGMLRSSVEGYVKLIQDMRWTWLHATGDFVIGDNPFCRINAAQTFVNYPLARPDLQVLFPIGRHRCLLMHRDPGMPAEIDVLNDEVRRVNNLQISSAYEKVWGPSEAALTQETGNVPSHPIHITLQTPLGEVVVDRMD